MTTFAPGWTVRRRPECPRCGRPAAVTKALASREVGAFRCDECGAHYQAGRIGSGPWYIRPTLKGHTPTPRASTPARIPDGLTILRTLARSARKAAS